MALIEKRPNLFEKRFYVFNMWEMLGIRNGCGLNCWISFTVVFYNSCTV